MAEKRIPKAEAKPGAVAAPDSPGATVAPETREEAEAHPAEPPSVSMAAQAGAPAAENSAKARPAGPATAGPANGSAGKRFPGTMQDFDFSKLFSEMKVPAMPDMEALLVTYKRNLEALSEANRVALEGAQAVARRHMEIMQATMSELNDSLKSLAVAEAPASRAAKHAELLKHAYENTVANTRELSDLIQKSNGEAMQKLNYRFSEAMNELKALFNKL